MYYTNYSATIQTSIIGTDCYHYFLFPLFFSVNISTVDIHTCCFGSLFTKALEHIPLVLSTNGQLAFRHTSVSTSATIITSHNIFCNPNVISTPRTTPIPTQIQSSTSLDTIFISPHIVLRDCISYEPHS